MTLSTSTVEATRRIGLRVKAARMRAGVSQEKLGAALGVTFQQVQKYENGRNRIAVTTLQAMAAYLGVPAAELLDDPASDVPLAATVPTAESLRLLQGFSRIADPAVRRRLVALVDAMAEPIGTPS